MSFVLIDQLVSEYRQAVGPKTREQVLSRFRSAGILTLTYPMKPVIVYRDPECEECWYFRHFSPRQDVWFCVGGQDNPAVGYSFSDGQVLQNRATAYQWAYFVLTAVRVHTFIDPTLQDVLWTDERLIRLFRQV